MAARTKRASDALHPPMRRGLSGVKGSSLGTAAGGSGLPAQNDDQEVAEEYFEMGWRARQVAVEIRVDLGLVSTWYFAWQRRQESAGEGAAPCAA